MERDYPPECERERCTVECAHYWTARLNIVFMIMIDGFKKVER